MTKLNKLFFVVLSISFLNVTNLVHAATLGLKVAEPEKVCMVNDRYFGVEQIPVHIGEQTYYGCCPNCEKTLNEQPNSRFAIDPVTKNQVDKSKAIIGKTESNEVFYFESFESLKKYNLTLVK